MDNDGTRPLQPGEAVRYDGYASSVVGVIVERLSDEYLRVLWDDSCVPTTHRAHCLVRDLQDAAAHP